MFKRERVTQKLCQFFSKEVQMLDNIKVRAKFEKYKHRIIPRVEKIILFCSKRGYNGCSVVFKHFKGSNEKFYGEMFDIINKEFSRRGFTVSKEEHVVEEETFGWSWGRGATIMWNDV